MYIHIYPYIVHTINTHRYYELLASSSELRASCRWYMTQSVYKSDKVRAVGPLPQRSSEAGTAPKCERA